MLKTRSVGAESPRRGGAPRGIFSLWSETKSVGAHSICARGSLPCRKRARADMESAPTFFCSGRVPSQRRCPAWSCLPLLKAKSVGAHSICARGGLSCRKRARADMESAPTFFCSGRVPSQRRCPAWSCLPLLKAKSVGAHSICARGGLSCRKRARADMESAPTFFVGAAKGRVLACCACKRIYFRLRLVKNHLMWYTISLQVHRQTRCKPATQSYRGPSGQPVANKKLLFYCRR